MKALNSSRVLLLLLLIFILTGNLSAMGAREDSEAYKADRQQVFEQLMSDIYEGGEDSVSAENKLKDLRSKYDIAYTDEEGILDAIIDRAQEQTMTREEAEFYFELLQEGKLMEYRREASRVKSELHHRELIALLRQKLQSAGPGEESADELLTVLNNYYNFVGLEYDNEYSSLSGLILSFAEGRITAGAMMSNLRSMDQQLTKNYNQNNTQYNAGMMNQNSTEHSADINIQPSAEPSQAPASNPQAAGAGSQEPQGSGMNSNSHN